MVSLAESLQSNYWFVPTLMAILAALLALLMVEIDENLDIEFIRSLGWVVINEPEGERVILSTIASSMITVAGTVFSLTMVALALVSQQFGPRLLGNFMRDRGNQIVLGTFIATFVYCLLVLRTISAVEDALFTPHLSVLVAILLAVASLTVLIYFIHHVSDSIQIFSIIDRVGDELDAAIQRVFPETLGREALPSKRSRSVDDVPADFEQTAFPVKALNSGYLKEVNADKLMSLAVQGDLLLRLKPHPGAYVVQGHTIALIWPPDRASIEAVKAINSTLTLGIRRTHIQDIEFLVNQLVEIAVRALSPAINDPFTAITAIDRLGGALCYLAAREIPSPYRYDDSGRLRVIASPTSFHALTDAAFSQIRIYGQSNPLVDVRLLETLRSVAECVQRPEDRTVLRRHSIMIERASRESITEEWDRQDVLERFQAVMSVLEDQSKTSAVDS